MNDLEKKQNTDLARQTKAKGMEEFDNKELLIPQACVAQAMSKVISEGDGKIKVGDIYNNVTNEVMKTEFVPIIVTNVWIKFQDGALLYRATSSQDPAVVADPDSWRAKRIQVLAVFGDDNNPTIIQFGGASYKEGQKFVSMMQFKGEDIFNNVYSLSTEKQSNAMGTFYALKVNTVGKASQEQKERAAAYHSSFLSNIKSIQAVEVTTTMDYNDDEKVLY